MKSRYDEMRDQARAFHQAHPKVWELFCKFTRERIARGFKNYSVNGVFERIRWETDQVDVDGKNSFKLNNNFRPFYARGFMVKFPQHDGFFRIRKQISKNEPATHLPPLNPDFFD